MGWVGRIYFSIIGLEKSLTVTVIEQLSVRPRKYSVKSTLWPLTVFKRKTHCVNEVRLPPRSLIDLILLHVIMLLLMKCVQVDGVQVRITEIPQRWNLSWEMESTPKSFGVSGSILLNHSTLESLSGTQPITLSMWSFHPHEQDILIPYPVSVSSGRKEEMCLSVLVECAWCWLDGSCPLKLDTTFENYPTTSVNYLSYFQLRCMKHSRNDTLLFIWYWVLGFSNLM